MAKINFAKVRGLTLQVFASDNGEHFPTNMTDAVSFMKNVPDTAGVSDDQFELVYQGPRMKDPGEAILMKEKEPTRRADGQWEKVYLFCDGHVQVQTTADGNFDAWEKEHTLSEATPEASPAAP